jgi:hypothetical protein
MNVFYMMVIPWSCLETSASRQLPLKKLRTTGIPVSAKLASVGHDNFKLSEHILRETPEVPDGLREFSYIFEGG